MAQERLRMRNIMEIFKLRFEQKKTPRAIARATGRGRTTVQGYLARAIQVVIFPPKSGHGFYAASASLSYSTGLM